MVKLLRVGLMYRFFERFVAFVLVRLERCEVLCDFFVSGVRMGPFRIPAVGDRRVIWESASCEMRASSRTIDDVQLPEGRCDSSGSKSRGRDRKVATRDRQLGDTRQAARRHSRPSDKCRIVVDDGDLRDLPHRLLMLVLS